MAALSGGHLATDFASGSVPALLPFFTAKFDLSYTLTAVLMLAVLASSSLTQPLFGLWSDRRGALWLLPAGLALGGAGIGLAAIAPSYGILVVLVFLSGLGIAAYHPEGAKFAVFASGRKRASGMSLVQHRRQHRLRARPDHRHPARAVARPRAGRVARLDSRRPRLVRRARGAPVPLPPAPGAGAGQVRHRWGRTTSVRWSCSAA